MMIVPPMVSIQVKIINPSIKTNHHAYDILLLSVGNNDRSNNTAHIKPTTPVMIVNTSPEDNMPNATIIDQILPIRMTIFEAKKFFLSQTISTRQAIKIKIAGKKRFDIPIIMANINITPPTSSNNHHSNGIFFKLFELIIFMAIKRIMASIIPITPKMTDRISAVKIKVILSLTAINAPIRVITLEADVPTRVCSPI